MEEGAMQLAEANRLLDSQYLPLESGWIRHDDGRAHVAARTHMIGVSGKMFEWWFGYVHTTEHYLWWHPRDHVFSDWIGPRGTGEYVGGTHIVHEYFGGGPTLFKLRINFRDPSAILDTSRFAQAGVSAAVYARTGPLDRDLWVGHTLHLVHDTPEGCIVRTRFWLGEIDPMPKPISREDMMKLVPDERVSGLHQHASEEMSILGGFLPTLYRIHNPAC
jgi:hypothetical protein